MMQNLDNPEGGWWGRKGENDHVLGNPLNRHDPKNCKICRLQKLTVWKDGSRKWQILWEAKAVVSGCHRGLGTRCLDVGWHQAYALVSSRKASLSMLHRRQTTSGFKNRARDCSILATCRNPGTNSNVHLAIKEPREMLLLSPTPCYTLTEQTMAPRMGLKSHGSFS